jgi:BirA family transcriptional regulator, biotin operon repressor / biotin---[acetyl-CoA-carboxylase] ligase
VTPLNVGRLSRPVVYYRTLDSTMTAAAPLGFGAVVVADQQTAGQGRHGHTWHSEPFAGLYCSIVMQPSPALTLALGLAAAEAIDEATGIVCDLRWPNDLMLGEKKVAGILVQLADGKAVAGIGINVNQAALPEELAATSLRLHAGRGFEREEILEKLLEAVDRFAALDTVSVLRLFTRASSYAVGRRVRVDQPGGTVEGTTAGLDPSGFLIVRKDDGTSVLILAGGVRAVSQ